jgi:hypothetical protein
VSCASRPVNAARRVCELAMAVEVAILPIAGFRVLRDAENHHGRGVHDADKDSGEPDCRMGEVSLAIGKVPGTPGPCAP